MTAKRHELTDLGEFGLIERIRQTFTLRNPSSVKGIGDDAAVIDAGAHFQLLSTDMLLEGIHFDLAYMPLQHLGYKAIAANVSDIAAMNGYPKQVVVSLALSNRFSVEAVDTLYQGMRTACENYQVDLVGGDTSASPGGLIISVAVVGAVAKDKVVYRSGARPNDIICVTGDLGGAYAGLLVLQREKEVFLSNSQAQPDLEPFQYVVGRQLKPEARMDMVHELAELPVVPTAMIDISDGLASELLHLAVQSKCGFKIFEDKIPIDTETFNVVSLDFKIDPVTCALNGGEDYELLFTIRQDDLDKVKNHPDIHLIGHMHDQAGRHLMITKGGNTVPVTAQGWNHFR
jgi:thiamine-monophosphate kinase